MVRGKSAIVELYWCFNSQTTHISDFLTCWRWV